MASGVFQKVFLWGYLDFLVKVSCWEKTKIIVGGMKQMTDKQKVEGFIRRYIKKVRFDEDTDIFSLGVINSLLAMQLALFVEQNFDITVDNDVIGTPKFNSINSIMAYIYMKKQIGILNKGWIFQMILEKNNLKLKLRTLKSAMEPW